MECTDAVLALGDTHMPWHKKSLLAKIFRIVEDTKPKHIIQMGDLYERFAQSRFAKTAGLITPVREADTGRTAAEFMWREIRKRSPASKCYQLRGNHDARALKVMLDKAPELEPFFDDKDFYRFPGVDTVFDPTHPLMINGVLYTHGWGPMGSHMRYFLKPVVRAHSHTAGVVFMNLYGKVIYEMDVGYLADHRAVPLRYRPTTVTRWTHTVGWVDSNGPRVILL